MTISQALYIKYLRERCNGSWRWVAIKYENRYVHKLPFNNNSVYGGNQLEGMKLCSQAMITLKEKWD